MRGQKEMNLKDRVAIITGAAGGIGAAIAVGYAKEGTKIVIADILDGRGTVEAVKKAGSEAIFVQTDVTKQEQCDGKGSRGPLWQYPYPCEQCRHVRQHH
jgi:NAD(P)-dependent dehydrogenase (short-subunit alcohol dehydrogenase family)